MHGRSVRYRGCANWISARTSWNTSIRMHSPAYPISATLPSIIIGNYNIIIIISLWPIQMWLKFWMCRLKHTSGFPAFLTPLSVLTKLNQTSNEFPSLVDSLKEMSWFSNYALNYAPQLPILVIPMPLHVPLLTKEMFWFSRRRSVPFGWAWNLFTEAEAIEAMRSSARHAAAWLIDAVPGIWATELNWRLVTSDGERRMGMSWMNTIEKETRLQVKRTCLHFRFVSVTVIVSSQSFPSFSPIRHFITE